MPERDLAKEWLARAAGKWRLQVLQKRGRNVLSDGRWSRSELPVRVRRFLNGTPVGMVHEVLRILDTTTEIPEEALFNREPKDPGEANSYNPVRTYIVKDGSPNESGGRDPTYTIVQDLRLASDGGDGIGMQPSDSSCSQYAETEYVWDSPEVIPAPAGGQGVSYRVTNVSRDQETDLFSYQLQKQVAVTTFHSEVTECNEYEKVVRDTWDNLYGEPGAFGSNVESRDPFVLKPVSVPEPCCAPAGTTVGVQVQRNPDCTYRVVVETREAREKVRVTETRRGLRGVTESETTVATCPLPETGLELGEQVRNELRPDGLYDVTHVTVAKENVGDVGSSCGRTVFEHQHAETRNESARPEDEADFAGGGRTYQVQSRATEEGTWDVTRTETTEIERKGAQKTRQKTLRGVTETTVDRNVDDGDVTVTNVGDRVSVEMTPGGKYNRTVTTVSKEPVGDVGSNCEKTVFQHTHVESENVPDRPEPEAGSAGGGKTYQVQARATEEGTWDVSRTVTEETRDVTAQHVMRKTLRGVTETTVTRSTSDSSVSVSEIGDEVRVEQTPGGLWNRTETRASHEAVGVIGKSCSSTPAVHTDVTVSNVPNGSQPEPQHQSPEANVERTVETRRTEEGTWDVTERSTVHQQDVITGLKAGSEAAEVEIEIGKNVVGKPTSDTGTVNVETSISASKNDHGSYDYQKRTTTYKPWGERKIAESENDSQRVEFHSFQNLTEVPDMTAGHGQSISASVSRNNVGSYDGSFRVVTGKPYGEERIASAENDSQTVEFHAFQNLDAPPPMKAGQGESITASVSRNELGLFDGNYRKVVGKPYGEERIASAENDSQTVEFHTFQNLDAPPEMKAGQGESISASVSRNELGLFDGNYRKVVGKPYGEERIATATNQSQDVEFHTFQNLDAPPPMEAGQGESISASVSRNELGLFDGNYRKVVGKPYGEEKIASAENDSQTVEFHTFQNLDAPPPMEAGHGESITASVSRNELGLFDGNYRKVVGKPYGEERIATATNQSQDVEFHTFQNLDAPPPMEAGQGESITASVSRNELGLFDGNYRKVVGKPYGEERIATATNQSQDVEFHTFQNLDAPPPMEAGQGESITASVSRNELGLFDGSFRKVVGKPYGEEKIASAENDSQTVEFHAFQNLDAPPPMDAAQGESITASVSRNELGLFDGNFRVTKAKGKPDEEIARIENNAEVVELRQFQNLPSPPPMTAGGDQHLSASVNRNEFGLFDGSWRRTTVQALDSDWIEWDSETKTPTQTLKYHHGIRIFRNLDVPPTPPDGAQSSISVHFNEVGKYDGSISYSRLTEWTAGSGGGGSSHSADVKRKVLRGGKVTTAWVRVDTWVDTDPPSASMIGEGQVIHWGGGLYQVAHVTVDGDVVQN